VRKTEKVVVVSGSGAAENRAAGLTVRHCDISLTLRQGVVAGSKACRPIAGYSAGQAYVSAYVIGIYTRSGERRGKGEKGGEKKRRKEV